MKTTYNASQAIEKISDQSNYNFSLKYRRICYTSGLNITTAKSGYSISNLCLNKKDIETLESFLAKKGIVAEYSITKAKNWARCQTSIDRNDMVELAKYLRSLK